ncbi:hypothetical protein [Streptosporangium sp. V21-05]|uniref:hypothetical protein n=1 Tax=Streptosporangium sp. V21-05 TaxID=3446115 RepID=UPI003F5386FE
MRTAMAAGVLALALGGGIPAVALVPVSAARADAVARLDDCDHGGLLGTVTGTVCRAVDGVVHGLTGGVLLPSPSSPPPGTDGDAEAPPEVEEAPAGTESPAPAPSATKPPSGHPRRPPAKDEERPSGGTHAPQPQGPADVCRSVTSAASAKCGDSPGSSDSAVAPLVEEPQEPGVSETPSPKPSSPSPSPSATPSPSPSRDQGAVPARKSPVPVPTDRPPFPETSFPDTRTPTAEVGEPPAPKPSPVVDAEAPRVELLWPAPVMQELQRQMPDAQPVTPSRSSDTTSTVLTTAVLVSAILAVRLLYSRRKVRESIPFEPAPPSHHRVA